MRTELAAVRAEAAKPRWRRPRLAPGSRQRRAPAAQGDQGEEQGAKPADEHGVPTGSNPEDGSDCSDTRDDSKN
ncbi:hypothetical protein [Cupriavidus sp. amp6]|uniref:hypothetical protein n=1 Tax=Cupriavidus sp. amp6 TaxID=388051 RepID=UPI0018DE2485|nr:hypothetical protein [Cupriavidus sp. amp6]